jgi:putative protease
MPLPKVELLSPAKNLECGIAAINCGADAVYIGAHKFGARSTVGNSLADIEKLILYAHKYWAKVYVTVNTILNDKEILEAEKLIKQLYEIGTDAVIVQDMGLLELDLPPIPLFASTQTHNNTWQKVEFLEKAGFQRVILARELSLPQIKEIKSKTNIDLECFIHGALCVSYSGQCYLSYAIGGRSGNRGECAQPCRKLYSLSDSSGKIIAKDKYLLSLKDLNLTKYLEELIDNGVSSFKIEGRLKDINYIKNTVSFYREKIDQILEKKNIDKSSSGKSFINFTPDPYKTFNRGFTDYFLNGRKKEIISIDTPKSKGEFIGKVTGIDKNSFTVDTKIKLHNGDGICFFDSNNTLQGTTVNKAENNQIYPNDISLIKQNMLVYRNLDHEFLKNLNNADIKRKISVKLRFYQENDEFILHVIDEDRIKAEQKLKIEAEIADNQEMALNNIKKQLSKLGETEFICKDVKVELENIYFIQIKQLNDLRRSTIELLIQNRLEKYPRQIYKIEKNNFPYPEKHMDYRANVLNKKAEDFYKRHGVIDIQPAAESGIDLHGKRVMITKHCLKYQFNLCSKNGSKNRISEPLYLIDQHNRKYPLNFNCKNCEMEILF